MRVTAQKYHEVMKARRDVLWFLLKYQHPATTDAQVAENRRQYQHYCERVLWIGYEAARRGVTL